MYSTCSIFPRENAEQIRSFLSKHHDAKEIPIGINIGLDAQPGRQILPGMAQMDGFYYAKLRKLASSVNSD